MRKDKTPKPPPPKSSSNYTINLLGVLIFFSAIFVIHKTFPAIGKPLLTIIGILLTIIPLWIYDFCSLRVHKRPSAGLDRTPNKPEKGRLMLKLIALYATFMIMGLWYYIIYHYFNADYIKTFCEFVILLAPAIIIGSFIYFRNVDLRQTNPYDEFWHVGCFLTGKWGEVDRKIIYEYLRVWFIKGFFIPYVCIILMRYVEIILSFNWQSISFFSIYTLLLDFSYAIDMIYGVLGYVLTCRLTDTHIRSTDKTILGWMVCLMCYGPFHMYFGIGLFPYDDGFHWNHWFALSPVLYYFYGSVIIFLSGVYALATVAIGHRMSNLTYRGLITSGPYYYTKHPAYLCKVLSWWLISLPFFTIEEPFTAVKHTCALIFISYIYYLRAKTEENHLSTYPEYVNYAEWINQHGLFSPVTKHFSALQFKRPQ